MAERDPDVVTVDGNQAAASVAYRLNEVIAVYPITPSSTMGELCDEWASQKKRNVFGLVPDVAEMQSEGGAAGAIHGALQAGALATTFTASQGLLLMIPNLYKIAGELTGFCMHVAARTVATHALSIFGDHSDVMACRATGFALLASGSPQEAHDLACIGQLASLRGRVPVLHFFDGFRTSHEVGRVRRLTDDELRALLDEKCVADHRRRALSPDRPVLRGSAQNPDVFFQAREAANVFHDAFPKIVREEMERFAALTGRRYAPFEYAGHPQAERVLVLMGSGAQTARELVDHLVARGERVGVLTVRLFRPFAAEEFVRVLPPTVRGIAVLDRTKEPGAIGEPLYQDVVTALREAGDAAQRGEVARSAVVIGGRYGLSSKEFTPAMAKAALDELERERPRNHFTVGIVDDVTHHSLEVDANFEVEPPETTRAVLWGLGSDGTVGSSKKTLEILGDHTDLHLQGYFVYDSKKSGAKTVSHLRFGPKPIRSAYLIRRANFVGCHQFQFVDRYDVLASAQPGATFLLNSPLPAERVWDALPVEMQRTIVERRLAFHVVDADQVAREAGLDGRINMVMQVCFFALTKLLPIETALAAIEKGIRSAYGRKGDEIVRRNLDAARRALDHLQKVDVKAVTATRTRPPPVPCEAPEFVQEVTAAMVADRGDELPVSAFPPDGTWPLGTAKFEKRGIADAIPIWDSKLCIQCNKCAFVCPHAAIRTNVFASDKLLGAPPEFRSTEYRGKEFVGQRYVVQVAPQDCTGCTLCAVVCPAKDKSDPRRKALVMEPAPKHVEREKAAFAFYDTLPTPSRAELDRVDVKTSQLLQPLFEFSGACSGCGETPYVKLLTQLFGDRLMVANATGCSSIYGGNLPTTPYCAGADGRGPAWSNSLFEDNAEFGFGMRLAVDRRGELARQLVSELAARLPERLVTALLAAEPGAAATKNGAAVPNHASESYAAKERWLVERRAAIAELKRALLTVDDARARRLLEVADDLAPRSVWLVGGDGWAYDIGFGGLDHVLASGRKVNALVLDTEVYSNTGGQQSKATPLGASARFAVAGKEIHKKDLGLVAMSYGNVYVASIAFGAKDSQTVQTFLEAESYPGPSLIVAYSHCIAHGYDLAHGLDQQRKAVGSGVWPLYRFDPRRAAQGLPPLQLDAGPPRERVRDYMAGEARFRIVERMDPARFARLADAAQRETDRRLRVYDHLSRLVVDGHGETAGRPVEPIAPSAAAPPTVAAPRGSNGSK